METTKIRGGQVGPYKDSIYEFEIISDKPENEVEEYCTTKLKKCIQKSQDGTFSGRCSFPFGLNSYYKFKKSADSTYRYTVCVPYTG